MTSSSRWKVDRALRTAAALGLFLWGAVPAALAQATQDKLVFSTAPAYVGVGLPSSMMVIERQTESGAPAPNPTALVVTLTSTSTAGQFALAPQPSEPWGAPQTVTIASGSASSAPFFYRDGTSGAPLLTAAAGGVTSGTHSLQVGPLGFIDDFESGTLLPSDSPPGRWNDSSTPVAANLFEVDAAAAHRGGFGFRLRDQDFQAGSGGQNELTFIMAPTLGSLYARLWFRVTPVMPSGSFMFIQVTAASPRASIAYTTLNYPGGSVQFKGDDRLGNTFQTNAQISLEPGRWYLFELALFGVGTSSGERRLWIDGELKTAHTGRDFLDWRVVELSIGESFAGDRTFTGTLEFDDVRLATSPHPSRISLTAPATATTSACLPVSVSLRDSVAGDPAPAPYDVEVDLNAAGAGAAFFADPECTQATARATVSEGQTTATAYLRASETGTATLSGAHVDFLSGSTTLDAVQGPAAQIRPLEQTVDPGQVASLDGSGSTASSGASLVRYFWSQTEGPTGVRLTDAAVQSLTLTEPGEYVFRLEVEDSLGARSAPTTARIVVNGDYFHPPGRVGCGCGGGAPAGVAAALLLLGVRGRGRTRWRLDSARRERKPFRPSPD